MSILDPLDLENLLDLGLVTPLRADGTRKIHKRRLHRSSDEENADLPLVPAPSPAADYFSVIPEEMISLATLEYLGLNKDTAAQIWNRWNSWPSNSIVPRETDDQSHGHSMPMSFIEFATGHFVSREQLNTCDEDNDQPWFDCLNNCGISTELQMAIMDPTFRRIRLTESCIFWAKDTILLRHRGLQEVQNASRERARALQRAASRPGGLSADSAMAAGRSISATLRMLPGISRDTAMSQAALKAANTPGSITLYKGIDQARLSGMFNEAGDVVQIQQLFSRDFATDFVSRASGLYFAVDRDIAELYACFIKHRDGVNSATIIQVTIKNSAIEGLSDTDLVRTYWPSAEWKNLVFCCRRFEKLPSRLRKFKLATLIIGTIARKPNFTYEQLDGPEQINERFVLKTRDGRNAVQYVFNDDQGDDFFQEHAVPSMKVFPFTANEFRAWTTT